MNSIMHDLNYINYPKGKKYDNPAIRKYLRETSKYSCAYCTITESESPGSTFHIDHFRPQSKFPDLKDECTNLRYCCPRCNLIKSDFWIPEEDGCIRDCINCHTKRCLENIFRLVDSYNEDPNEYFIILENDLLASVKGSKPAEHTIKYLRLNRPQLVKLRKIRRFLDLWREELQQNRVQALQILTHISSKKELFEQNSGNINAEYRTLIDILFKALETQAVYNLDLLEHELGKVDRLLELHKGGEDNAN